MRSFKDFYLLEADDEQVKEKLKHLEHIEDLIINNGYAGAQRAVEFLKRVIAHMDQPDPNLIINNKIDGAPSVVFGPIPAGEDNAGEFFVGTKSALSPKGKRYTKTESNRLMAENGPGLAEKLIACLKFLPELKPREIYQGDLLFTPDSIEEKTIDGVQYLTFKPNVITYAVPVNDPTAREVRRAKLGVVVHTSYKGDTFADMYATYTPNLEALAKTPNVWMKSNRLQQDAFSKDNSQHIQRELDLAANKLHVLNRSAMDSISTNPKLQEMIKLHLNSLIRQGKTISNPQIHVDELQAFIHHRLEASRAKFTTNKKQLEITGQQEQYKQAIDTMKGEYAKIFDFYVAIANVKLMFLKTLSSGVIGSYYEDQGKYRSTTGEGLVISDSKTNDVIKIVDRLDFSRINFNQPKDWK